MDCANLNLNNLAPADVAALSKLKAKVICEYQKLMDYVFRGHKLDYQHILEQISLIELLEDFELDDNSSLFVLQYYLNNGWEITLS